MENQASYFDAKRGLGLSVITSAIIAAIYPENADKGPLILGSLEFTLAATIYGSLYDSIQHRINHNSQKNYYCISEYLEEKTKNKLIANLDVINQFFYTYFK